MTERRFKDYKGRGIELPKNGSFEADGKLLELCDKCSKSRLTCENIYVREVEVPVNKGDKDEVIGEVRQPDGSYLKQGIGFRVVDGIKEELIKSEQDIPIPFVCQWFTPNTN